MKKIVTFFTLALMLISLIMPMNTAKAFENIPPTFDSFTINKKQVELYDQIEFYLVQSGSPYFLTDTILNYKKPNGELYPIHLYNAGSMYHYNREISFSNQEDIGLWTLDSIELSDDGDNHNLLSKDNFANIADYNFEVLPGTIDQNNPTINSITFKKNEVNAGEYNTVVVDAQDDSGVSSVTMGLISPSGKKQIELYSFNKNSNGLWESNFELPAYTEKGDWRVEYVNVWDINDNILSINTYDSYPDNFSTFLVHSENEDIDGPVIQSIKIEKNEMTADETNTIQVKVTDASGVSELSLAYGIEAGDNSTAYPTECTQTETVSIFECKVNIPYYLASGDYQILHVHARDNADNMSHVGFQDLPIEGINLIKLTNPHEDITSPVLNKVVMPTKVIKLDSVINLQISAKDLGSGVGAVDVYFENEFGDQVYGFDFNKTDKNTWSTDMYVYGNFHEGTYKIKRLALYDMAGNRTVREYTEDGVIEYKGDTQTILENAPVYKFIVINHSKAIKTAKSYVKVQTYGNQTVEVYHNDVLLGSKVANAYGKATVQYTSLPKNTRLKVLIKNAEGTTTEEFFTTIGESNTEIIQAPQEP